ncbi:nitroreductase family protein [Thalassococcus sp. CAU 1522]|uniref:Nitroreductase family protein n=1 Tax=Thalassococcus arenae TaxID=2851652 RepID=A0ABS6N9G8_9RHOB|nr:nitroreductase family protein [Thalassococcus arenae]MBV2360249.1 nitroreductase family protein [Thalassococcus arenae]
MFGRLLKKPSKSEKKARKLAEAFEVALAAEKTAVEAGLAAFEAGKAQVSRSSALLRRNVHRIEKGLCMPGPRRPVFAEQYLADTVMLYAKLAAAGDAEPDELKWAHDVLSRYFDAVDQSVAFVAEAKAVWDAANAPQQGAASDGAAFAPYRFADLPDYVGSELAALPDLDSYARLCRARRSQRWFSDTPVDPAVLERAVACAAQAPSACNRQPFRFYAARSREKVKAITDLPLGTAGFGADLPVVVAVVGDLSMYAHARDRHLIFVDSGLACMAFMQALTAAGLGSVPINWPDIPENHAALRDILGLAAYQVPVMLIGVGHPKPESMIPYSAKRPVHEVLHVVD